MAWGSSTVSPQPGMTPTRAWVSAKRARSEAIKEVTAEGQLEAAGDRDAVDGADEGLGVGRERALPGLDHGPDGGVGIPLAAGSEPP